MAKQRSNVPKLGDWEKEDDVPYTVYFDKARRNRGGHGKMINRNDPNENPDTFSNAHPSPSAPAPAPAPSQPRARPEQPIGMGDVRPTAPLHRVSREDGDFRKFSNSPAQNGNAGHRTTNEPSHGSRGQRSGRSARPSAGSEQSFERSPLRPQHQARVVGRGNVASPGWEGKSHDSSHGNAGRSRLRPANESPDRGAAVPRFGEWNESDPQAAENFTRIFNKVREERNTSTGNVSSTPRQPSTQGGTSQSSDEPKRCCFPWW